MQARFAKENDIFKLTLIAERFHKEFKNKSDPNFDVYEAGLHFSQGIFREDSCCIVVEYAHEIIGFITGRINKVQCSKAIESNNDYLYVLPEFRDKGAANVLIFMFVNWSKERERKLDARLWSVNLAFRYTINDEHISKLFKDTEFKKSGSIFSLRM